MKSGQKPKKREGPKVGYMGTEWQRFWSKIRIIENGCWQWDGAVNSAGYGQFHVALGKQMSAHRWAYEKCIGPIPLFLQLDHLCRNPSCVNPLHLDAVTSRTNLLRSPITAASLNANKTTCIRGHPLIDKEFYIDRRGYRVCRACQHIYKQQQKLKGKKK